MLVESGIQLKESRIPLTIAIQNPSSTDQDCWESNSWNPEYAALNPESKTALDSLAWGDSVITASQCVFCLLSLILDLMISVSIQV